MKVLFERVKLRLPNLILKGGACFNAPQVCLAANRNGGGPGFRSGYLGFRPIIRIKRLE